MMTPTIFFVLITSLIGAFQVFDVAYILGGASLVVAAPYCFICSIWITRVSATAALVMPPP